MDQPETFTETPSVVCLQLSLDQARQLAPLAIEATRSGENVLFVAVALPFWSQDLGAVVWEFQAIKSPARIGHKILKLIHETQKPARKARS